MDPIHESEALKPLDVSIKDDENEWPQFPLRDVTVTSQKTGGEISLLQAHKRGKVRVTGTLHDQDADPESRKRFKKRFQRQQQVYIQDVEIYSYGKYDDGSLAFWAAGEAGWFELRTLAQSYRPVYAQMEEATEMLYFLIGRASRQRKDWRKATDKEVSQIIYVTFNAFVDSLHNTKQRTDYRDCVDGFREHRHFLIKCMLEGAEGVDWGKTPFLRWYQNTIPQDYAVVINIVNQTGDVDLEELEPEHTPSAVMRTRARENSKEQEMDIARPIGGRRSKRLAAAEKEDSSSEELTSRRGRDRGRHKRKSMLRVPGSAKTPRKTHVRRVDGPSSVREPQMEFFREMRRLDDEDAPYPKPPAPEETTLRSGLVRDLSFADLDEEEERVAPSADYFSIKEPSGQWSCPLDGCNHTVYDANLATGKVLIKTHYAQTHQDSIEELIRSEARPWAKTSYLLEKVRSMKEVQFQGGGDGENAKSKKNLVFPSAIKRLV